MSIKIAQIVQAASSDTELDAENSKYCNLLCLNVNHSLLLGQGSRAGAERAALYRSWQHIFHIKVTPEYKQTSDSHTSIKAFTYHF